MIQSFSIGGANSPSDATIAAPTRPEELPIWERMICMSRLTRGWQAP